MATIKAPTPAGQSCGICGYYAADPTTPNQGWCRRYPPTPVYSFIYQTPTNLNPTMWPSIAVDDWCGEFNKNVAQSLPANSPP